MVSILFSIDFLEQLTGITMRLRFMASLCVLGSAALGCKVRSDSQVASYGSEQAQTKETEFTLAEWTGGRAGEVACACDGGKLVRYHATSSGVARVVLSENRDLESCVIARLKVRDSQEGKEDGQCHYAF